MIIAIHTSPLAAFSEMGDFILTRIVARVAVPFFFMTSGFFMISRYDYNAEKLKGFLKRTAVIYGIAILIYIPVNLYNGYFRMADLLPNMIKDILVDGTLYHLWYLPAVMIGSVIAWCLVKRLDYKKALIAAAFLYLIGLFGDSYYGIAGKIPGLNRFYGLIFQVCDYTRNGIFFAPVFLILGGLTADHGRRISLRTSMSGFGISFLIMLGEAVTLHHFNLQRHDSMYVFLLPCVYFLFNGLLHFKGKRPAGLRTISMIVYVIHPMAIIAIRLFANLLHLQKVLVENSIVHYLTVCFVSVSFSAAAAALWNKIRPRRKKHAAETGRAYVEINLDNLAHNVKVLQGALPEKCELMAVVKANAYGHGAFEISVHLNKMGIRAFAVATIDEGIKLRKYGIRGDILILGYTDIDRARELKKYDLTQTLIDFEYARALNRQGIFVKAHIKIDTGMHRLGIPWEEAPKVKKIFTMKNIKTCGIFTHLCCPDSLQPEDVAFTEKQIDRFYSLTEILKNSGITMPKLHIQSSYGLLNYPDLKCDYIRAGIALYGVLSSPDDDTVLKPDLRPVLSLKTKVVLIRSVRKGESVGYGRSFTAARDSRIAILPVGYGDGFPRNLSGGIASVLINGQCAPVVGRICMDQLAVDVTEIDAACVGTAAILIGEAGETALSAPLVADSVGSISNELLCRIGARLPVVVK